MSVHFVTSLRRRGCAHLPDRDWPRPTGEKRRTRSQGASTCSYLPLDGRGETTGPDLAIVKLLIGLPESSRQFPIAALYEAFAPIKAPVLHTAGHRLEDQCILARDRDDLGLSRAVRRLVELGLIPKK
jgi:hypothetical protein